MGVSLADFKSSSLRKCGLHMLKPIISEFYSGFQKNFI